MDGERPLDVSGLEPPEPLERILTTITTLAEGEFLHALLPREPFPLYPILDESGYAFRARPGHAATVELFIWRRNDARAATAVPRAA